MKESFLLVAFFLIFSVSASAEMLCEDNEEVVFSCGFGTKSVSVCGDGGKTLTYRFGAPQNIELELNSGIHFSRVGYSGGGEGNLTFQNGVYKYVVYSSISNGAWLDDGSREKKERSGVYVVENNKLIVDVECKSYSSESFITDLPAFEEEEFRYYE